MKKSKIIIPIILMATIIGSVSAYFIYGSTLIDITSEESISKNLSVDPKQPVKIYATAKNGDYFGVLYSDPTDEDGVFHFRYVTKAKLYKNKYHNSGGYSTFSEGSLSFEEVNSSDEKRKTAQVFIYRVGRTAESGNECTVFKYNITNSYIVPGETDPQQLTEKMEKLAASYKKVDGFALPDEDAFIIVKSYKLDNPDDNIDISDKALSEEEKKQSVIDEADDMINELF